MPIFRGNSIPKGVNQAIQLIPTGSVLIDYTSTSEIREFSVTIRFVFAEVNVKDTSLDHILRYVSRIEALVHENMAMTLSDSSNAFNCRLDSTDLDADDESGVYITEWAWKCQHLGNLG